MTMITTFFFSSIYLYYFSILSRSLTHKDVNHTVDGKDVNAQRYKRREKGNEEEAEKKRKKKMFVERNRTRQNTGSSL